MHEFMVKATNKRGYLQEEPFRDYSEALHYALECKDSGQYKTVIIVKYDPANEDYFLGRIIL